MARKKTDNLEQFVSNIDAIVKQVPDRHRDEQASIVAGAYNVAVLRTRVDTGAMRAEHVIKTEGSAVVQADERAGPTRRIPERSGNPLPGPDTSTAEDELKKKVRPFTDMTMRNDRFYVDDWEYGHSRLGAQPMYAPARVYIQSRIREKTDLFPEKVKP